VYESDYIVPLVSDGYTSGIINTYSFIWYLAKFWCV